MGAGGLHTQLPPPSSVLPCKGPHARVWTAACSSPPQPPQPHPSSIPRESRGRGQPGLWEGAGQPPSLGFACFGCRISLIPGDPCPVGGCGPEEAQSRVL